jgi:hypothetical protein
MRVDGFNNRLKLKELCRAVFVSVGAWQGFSERVTANSSIWRAQTRIDGKVA